VRAGLAPVEAVTALGAVTATRLQRRLQPAKVGEGCKTGRGRLMSEGTIGAWRVIGLRGIVLGLILMLPACTDFKDVLCRPQGHCVDAPDQSQPHF
jgi:hypothetical protein